IICSILHQLDRLYRDKLVSTKHPHDQKFLTSAHQFLYPHYISVFLTLIKGVFFLLALTSKRIGLIQADIYYVFLLFFRFVSI
ncbi:hypothetical protein BCV71DRAFT_190619, partial [Rhizopus microsporus]